VSLLLVAQRALTVPGWVKDALWRNARAVPSLDLRFAENKSLVDTVTGASLVTFTRASSGTFVDSAGVLQTAGTDVPRFNHNPTTGESLGLLVEEARTNLVLQSNAFTTTWQAVTTTLTSASVVSPDGTTNGWRFADTAANSTHNIFQSIAWTAVATTFTIYAKYDTHRWIGARIGATGNQFFGSWDLQNGVVGSFTAGATIGMQAVGDGWYRLTLTTTLTSAGTANVLVYLNNADSASVLTYTGTETGSYIYGAQLEAGAFPSSYIPTTTAAATRAADVASITGSAFSSWYRQDEGTMFTEYRDHGVSGGNRYPCVTTDGATNNRIGFFINGTTTINNRHVAGGTSTNPSVLNTVLNICNRHAIAAAVGSCNAASNGTLATASAPASMPSVSQLNIGFFTFGSTEFLNAPVARITFWPQRLPNSTLQSITS